jgi:hypothetical protein
MSIMVDIRDSSISKERKAELINTDYEQDLESEEETGAKSKLKSLAKNPAKLCGPIVCVWLCNGVMAGFFGYYWLNNPDEMN